MNLKNHPAQILVDDKVLAALSEVGVYITNYKSGYALYSKTWADIQNRFEVNSDHADMMENIHPDDRKLVIQGLVDVAEGRTDTFDIIYRLESGNGSYKWIKSKGKSVSHQKDGTPFVFLGSDVDITEIKEAEARLKKSIDLEKQRSEELEILRQISTSITRSLDTDITVKTILREMNRIIPFEVGSIQILQDSYLKVIGVFGFDEKKSVDLKFKFPVKGSLSTKALQTRKAILTNNVAEDFPNFTQPFKNKEIKSWIGVPLISQGEILGLMALDGLQNNTFNNHHLELAAIIADQTTIALQNTLLHEKAYNMAMVDALTGIGSRYRFELEGRLLFNGAVRTEAPLSLAMIDIDFFKKVNDRYGHDTGDIVLKRIAETCQNGKRAMDILARFGGEEFVMILPNTDQERALIAMERIRKMIEAITHPEINSKVTISAGIYSCIPGQDDKLSLIVAKADKALYRAKENGRNRLSCYDDTDETIPPSSVY